MKKLYSKPEIMFESFAMSTNIAGNCDEKIETSNAGNCGLTMGPMMVFLENVSGCTFKVGDGEYDGLCYHVPTNDKNLFNS